MLVNPEGLPFSNAQLRQASLARLVAPAGQSGIRWFPARPHFRAKKAQQQRLPADR
jgi:hypothetical protein